MIQIVARFERTMASARPLAVPLPPPPMRRQNVIHLSRIWQAEQGRKLEATQNRIRLQNRAMPAPRRASPRTLIGMVAAWHGLTIDDILMRKRNAALKAPRYDAVMAVRTAFPHLSLPQIGRIFGRDHTTILYILRGYRKNRGGRCNGEPT